MKFHIFRIIIICTLLGAPVCGRNVDKEQRDPNFTSKAGHPSRLSLGGGIKGFANIDSMLGLSTHDGHMSIHLRGAGSHVGNDLDGDRQLQVDNIFRTNLDCDAFCNKPRNNCGNKCNAQIASCEARDVACDPWLCTAFCSGDRSSTYCQNRRISTSECNRYRKRCGCKEYRTTGRYKPVTGLAAIYDSLADEIIVTWDKVKGPKHYHILVSQNGQKLEKVSARGRKKGLAASPIFEPGQSYDIAVRRKKTKTMEASPYTMIQYEHITAVDPAQQHRAYNDLVSTTEDYTGDVTGNVLLNDFDPDFGHTLTVDLDRVSGPPGSAKVLSGDGGSVIITLTNGSTLSLRSDGSYAFRRAPGSYQEFSGAQTDFETFTYAFNDGHGNSAEADLVIGIQGVNDAPIAVSDLFYHRSPGGSAPLGDVAEGCVLENDADVDHGDEASLAVCVVGGSELQRSSNHQVFDLGDNVKLVIAVDGCFSMFGLSSKYAKLQNGTTADECFFYRACDGHHDDSSNYMSNVAEACVRVEGAFVDACVPNPCEHGTCSASSTNAGSYSCNCDSGWEIPEGGAICSQDINECVVTLNGGCDPLTNCTNTAGGYVCGPCPPGYSGTGKTKCIDESQIHQALDDMAPTNEDQVSDIAGNVLDNDSDPDFGHALKVDLHQVVGPAGSTVTYSGDGLSMMIKLPNGSTLSLSTTGNYTFRRASGAYQELSGTQDEYEQFKYVVDDNHGNTAGATLYVRIQGSNDAPIALNDLFVHSSSGPITIEDVADGCVLENDKDIDIGDVASLTVCVVNGVEIQNDIHQHVDLGQHTMLSIGADGCFTISGLATEYQYLPKGETTDVCFFYQACDGFGYKSNVAETCVRVEGIYDNTTEIPKPCVPNPCEHGTCSESSAAAGGYSCSCDSGWMGVDCDEDVNECLTNNGGCDALVNCTNTAGGCACGHCPPGYSGTGDTECIEIIIDPCDLSPCVHGTCSTSTTVVGGYSCSCDAGWKGTNCNESTGDIDLGLNCSLVHRILPINAQPFRTLDLSQWEGESVTILPTLSEPRLVLDIPLSPYLVEGLDSVLALHQSFTLEASKPGDTSLAFPNFLKGIDMCQTRFNATFFIPTGTRKICFGNETCRLACPSTFPSAQREGLAKEYIHENSTSHRYLCVRPGDSICQEEGEWDFSIGQKSSDFVSYYKRVGVFYANTTLFCFGDSNSVGDVGQPRFLLRDDINNETLGSLFCSRDPTGPVEMKITSANESEYTGLPLVRFNEKDSKESLLKIGWATVTDSPSPIACLSLRSDCRYDGNKENRPLFCNDVETYDSLLAYFITPTSAGEVGADEKNFISHFWNKTKVEYEAQLDSTGIEELDEVAFVEWYFSKVSSAIDFDKIFGDVSTEDTSLNTTIVEQSHRSLEPSSSDYCALLLLDFVFDFIVMILGILGLNRKSAEPVTEVLLVGVNTKYFYDVIEIGILTKQSPSTLTIGLLKTFFSAISAHTIMSALEDNVEKIGRALIEFAFQRFMLMYATGGLYLAVQFYYLAQSIIDLIRQTSGLQTCFGSSGGISSELIKPPFSQSIGVHNNPGFEGTFTLLVSKMADLEIQVTAEGSGPGSPYTAGCLSGIAVRSRRITVELSTTGTFSHGRRRITSDRRDGGCPLNLFLNGIQRGRESVFLSSSGVLFMGTVATLTNGISVKARPIRTRLCSCTLEDVGFSIPGQMVKEDMLGPWANRRYHDRSGNNITVPAEEDFQNTDDYHDALEEFKFNYWTRIWCATSSLFSSGKLGCVAQRLPAVSGDGFYWKDLTKDYPLGLGVSPSQLLRGDGRIFPTLTTQAFFTFRLDQRYIESYGHSTDQHFGSLPNAVVVHHAEGYLRNFPLILTDDGSIIRDGIKDDMIYSNFATVEATYPAESFNFIAYPVFGGFENKTHNLYRRSSYRRISPTPLDARKNLCVKQATKIRPEYPEYQDDPNGERCYGYDVAITSNTAVVSSFSHKEQLFFIIMRSSTGRWLQKQILRFPFSENYPRWGIRPIAVSENTMLIGQSAYTFENDTWAFSEDLSKIIAASTTETDQSYEKYGVSLHGDTAVFCFNQTITVLTRIEGNWRNSFEHKVSTGYKHLVHDSNERRIVFVGQNPLELIVYTKEEDDSTWSRQTITGIPGSLSLQTLRYEGLALCGDTIYAAAWRNYRIDRYGLSQSGDWELEAVLTPDAEGYAPAQIDNIACSGNTVFAGFPQSSHHKRRAGEVRSYTKRGTNVSLTPFFDDYDQSVIEASNYTEGAERYQLTKKFFGTKIDSGGNNIIISAPGSHMMCNDLPWAGDLNQGDGSVYIYEFEDC